jgi:hypothetical protein
MLYKAVEIMDDQAYVVRTMFKSFVERDCWDYIRSRIEVSNSAIIEQPSLYVINSAGEFSEPPEDVRALKRYKELTNV